MIAPEVETPMLTITTVYASSRTDFLYLINRDGSNVIITPEEFKSIVDFVYAYLPVYMEEF